MLPPMQRRVAAPGAGTISETPTGGRDRSGSPVGQRGRLWIHGLLALLAAPLPSLAAAPPAPSRPAAARRDAPREGGLHSPPMRLPGGCPVFGRSAIGVAAVCLGLFGLATSLADDPRAKREQAILAGGCFWGMEEILRKIPGVESTTVGYTGGNSPAPTYQQVCTGLTGHAEAVEIVFDPAVLPYEKLLEYFFRMHDPTTPNRQHNDVGTQYRSAIFWTTPEQEATARRVIAEVTKAGRFRRPIVTQVVKAGPFFAAEAYHQDYLVKNPGGYNCHVLQDW